MSFDKNSLDRPDIGFFESVLKRKIPRPQSVPETHALIEDLLCEAYEKKPDDLIRAAGIRQLKSFWDSIGHRKDVVHESLDFVRSRLWERDPSGIPAEARDPSKGSSTNAIKFYRASEHGVVGYLRQHITWILNDFVGNLAEQNRFISTDYLEDEKGLTLASNHAFIKQSKSSEIDRIEERSSDARSGLTNRSLDRVHVALSQLDEETPDRDGYALAEIDDPTASKSGNSSRAKFRPLKDFDQIELRSRNRPDLDLFREELGLDVRLSGDIESRTKQLRGLALELLQKRCGQMPDCDAAIEAVTDWPVMEKPFQSFFVEVTEWLAENPKSSTQPHAGGQALAGEHQDDLFGSISDLEILSTPLDSQSQINLAQVAIEESKMWRLRSTEQQLESPGRADYSFLKHRLGYSTPTLQNRAERFQELRSLGLEFIDTLFSGSPNLRGHFKSELIQWDPANSFFNEEIGRVIELVLEKDLLEPEDVNRVTNSFHSRYREPVDHEFVARLEAARLEDVTRGIAQTYLLSDVEAEETKPRRARRRPSEKPDLQREKPDVEIDFI